MKNLLLALFLNILSTCLLPAQPNIQWQLVTGGSNIDEATSVSQTMDGGYIVTGTSASVDGDVIGNHGAADCWVIKLDSSGVVQWKKAYGGGAHDVANHVQPTTDGGYVLAGFTHSNDGDVSGNHGDKDVWVLKMDSEGNIQWQKCLGGSSWDEAWDIRQANDGGYILAGTSNSTDGDVTGNHGSLDYWVVKLSPSGEINWQKSFGGSNFDFGYTICPTNDGGYIVAGESQSTDGEVVGNHGGLDAWVVKLNFEGKIEWQKPLGGTSADRVNEIHQTREGGYMAFGQTRSNNGDVTGNHGGYDFWAVKLSGDGTIEWQKALGGSSEDYGQSIQQTEDGGYIATGGVNSNNGDVTGNHGGSDLWVVKLAEGGSIEWQKAFGGSLTEIGFSIKQTNDRGYIVAGYAWSNNGDVTGVNGYNDFWIVKLSPSPSPTSAPSALPLEIFPNPAQQSITLKNPALFSEPTEYSEKFTVSITDLIGRKLSHQTISAHEQIDISKLPNSMYILTATTPSGKVFSGKFRKQE